MTNMRITEWQRDNLSLIVLYVCDLKELGIFGYIHSTSMDMGQKKLKADTSDSCAICLVKAVDYKKRFKQATLRQDNSYS